VRSRTDFDLRRVYIEKQIFGFRRVNQLAQLS